MKRTALLLLTIINSLSIFSYDFYVDGIYYRSFSTYYPDEVEVTYRQFYPYIGDIVIPSKVNYNGKTYSVTSIGTDAFSNCSKLTSVTIPNSVTKIWDRAFFCCTGLTSITIPNSVTDIIDEAFHGCTGLTSLTIPNGVKEIGSFAFAGCSNLTSITIPQSINGIASTAFERCFKITKVIVNCKFLNDCFMGKSSIKEVILGEGVTSIGKRALYNCTGLTTITIPRSVENIYYDAFWGCKFTSVTINCESINQCFNKMGSIKEIILGDGVTTIGTKAFYECGGLLSITIPNSVTSINDYAFYRCSSLTSITIPNSVKYLGQGAFSGCKSLTSVSISNSIPSIKLGAFAGCNSLTSVTIPDGVLAIQDKAFYGCSNITEVTISKSVTSIGHSAFWECNIASVISLNTTPPEIEAESFDYLGSKNRNVTLYVPKGCRNVYISKSYWELFFNNIVELSNTGIDDVKTCSFARNQSVYTINGTKVLESVENINSLPKGAYIINGKKLIIK